MPVFNVATLKDHVGRELGVGAWREIAQRDIDRFAETTGDRQWIHVDPVRAAAESPFTTTIAHGFLTLSLISALLRDAVTIEGIRMAINYGLDRVRFVTPVPSGARIRGRVSLKAVDERADARQVVWLITVELEGAQKPCLVAEWIVRYYAG